MSKALNYDTRGKFTKVWSPNLVAKTAIASPPNCTHCYGFKSLLDLWPNGSNPLELSDCINEIMQNPNNKSLKQAPCSTAFSFCMKDAAYSFAPILVQKPSYRLSIIKIYPADT